MSSVRIFSSLSGARTIARLFSAPNQVIFGIYDPTKPTLPLHSLDGNTAYGFRSFFNGYVFGPEGTSLAQLQDAVDAGQLPMIHANSANVYPRLTIEDYLDAMYINVGALGSVYSTYVKSAPVVIEPPVVVDPPVIDPPKPSVDPCQSYKNQITDLKLRVSELQGELKDAERDLDKEMTINNGIVKVITSVTISTRGGGVPMNALRKIKALLGA